MLSLLGREQRLEPLRIALADEYKASRAQRTVYHVGGVTVPTHCHRQGVFPLPAEAGQRQLG